MLSSLTIGNTRGIVSKHRAAHGFAGNVCRPGRSGMLWPVPLGSVRSFIGMAPEGSNARGLARLGAISRQLTACRAANSSVSSTTGTGQPALLSFLNIMHFVCAVQHHTGLFSALGGPLVPYPSCCQLAFTSNSRTAHPWGHMSCYAVDKAAGTGTATAAAPQTVNGSGYRFPPKEIRDIVDAPAQPSLSFSPDRKLVSSLL